MKQQLTLILLLSTLFLLPPSLAAPKSELWEVWLTHADKATLQLDHSSWQQFLDRRLSAGRDGVNLVDYAGATTESDELKSYLSYLQGIPVSKLTRPQQRAFWINLYNAATVSTVIENYPVQSIRDIDTSPGLFSDGPWGSKLFRIEGLKLSLDDIEHRILRPIWKDNRLHYALNCASVGCPNLQPRAFTVNNAETLLNAGADEYINHPRGAKVVNGELLVSSIYKWFQTDFGNNENGVIKHLRRYAKNDLPNKLDGVDEIEGYDYDWSLNGLTNAEKH
ncbi:MAG: DUF547 domain-containing protein [Gammaproteobacteria bacterium]|nr:DUF547 domain-containing protein [Gammaproteobacteria bacterium]